MNLSKDICSEGGELRAVSGPKIRAWSRHPRSGPPPKKNNKETANIEATKKGRRDSRSGYNYKYNYKYKYKYKYNYKY